jgi:hypothetical protein
MPVLPTSAQLFHDFTLEAALADVRTTELAMRAGYSRDRIRVIHREARIEPLSTGRPPKAVTRTAGGP